MKKLLNTLYVTSENSYLGLDGENIVVFEEQKEIGRLPLHNLEGIVSFGYRGTSNNKNIFDDTPISIHAPAKGATHCISALVRSMLFQSTLPRRERHRQRMM